MQIRMSSFSRSVVLGVLLVVGWMTLGAQSNTSTLTGTVSDTTGAMMPGVTVTLASPSSGTTQTATTKNKGEYAFEQIAPGDYEVRVAVPGFSEQVDKVTVLVATPLRVDVKLTVGTSEVINVETGLEQVNTSDATLGKAFDSAQVQNLPYLANNITYLLSLQPGVLALDSGATSGGLNTDTRTGIVNGARQDQTNITLDGVDNNDQTNGYAFNGALRSTRESVEEFRVTTTNANADAGRSSGGQVSLVTRSGTNSIHGSAYEYYRGPATASNNWFTKQAQLNSGLHNIALKVLQNTYGASLGAPIKKDKLFFFGAYEGFKQASNVNVSETVPSVLGGGGLYTGNVTYLGCPLTAPGCASTAAVVTTLTSAEIASMDPNCKGNGTCPNGAGTDAAALAYFKQFPLANSNVGGDSYNTGTYTFSSPAPLHQITNIARLDYNINPQQVLFVRGNLQSDNQASALQFPGLSPGSNIFGNSKGIAAGHNWNVKSNLTNNFRYGLIRQGTATRGTGSQPYTSFSAISTIAGTTTSSVYIVTTNNFADDITYVKGRHVIQAGVNDRILSNSRYFDSPLQSFAAISPNLLAVAGIAGKGGSLDPSGFVGTAGCPDCLPVTASFRTFYNGAILANTGIIEETQTGTEYLVKNNSLVPAGAGVIPTHIYRNLEQEYYVQDQWKVTPRLTVTGGVRYTYLGTPYEKNGQEIAPTMSLSTFLQNRAAAAATGGAYTNRIAFGAAGSANGAANFWTPQKANFAPRVSFAYATADNKTSIRGGFAMAYDHVGEGIIDYYESTGSSLLSLSKANTVTYSNVDTNPRYTGYSNVPAASGTAPTLQLPAVPADNPFTFLRSINSVIKTPYAETFNLTVQQQYSRGFTSTISYVGRLGRHLLDNLDVAQPTNLYDPGSNQTYFQAATAYDKMIDAGTPAANVPDSGYFHNLFPNAVYAKKATGTTPAVSYKGAQAYYAYLAAGDRGNETDPLYAADTNSPEGSLTPNTPVGQQFRFFYPQTSSIFAQSTIASSGYNALQVSVRHVLRYGLRYDVNYTWSKSRDQGSSPERSSANLVTNTYNPKGNYAVSDFDVRHNVTADYTAPLPFGKGMPYLSNSNGLLERLVGGWQLNGVVHYSTGFPFSAVASGVYGTNFDTSSFFVQTGPIPTGGHQYVAAGQYETALKGITPAQATANLRYPYAGETGQRNAFRADGYFSLDDSLAKSFHTFREQQFRISAEVFNVLNTNRFNAITTNGSSTKFGQYTGGSATTSGLLLQPRQMQFSGKYTF